MDISSAFPVIKCECSDVDFERQDDSPLENVVPTHGETPGRIDEASRVGIETTRDRVHDSEFTKSVYWKLVRYTFDSLLESYIPTLKIITPMMEKVRKSEAGP